MTHIKLHRELALLALLALLWGSSYLFIKVAVAEIPPLTLIAARVTGAAVFLVAVLWLRGERLPTGNVIWAKLGLQAVFNSIGAWTVLAWGQQYVDAGLASVLNSTSPVFVALFTGLAARHEKLGAHRLGGAVLGLAGVVLIVGVGALRGLGTEIAGQLACLLGAALYAGAAIWGKRLSQIGAVATAAGTMLWATAVLVPLALVFEHPWSLTPSLSALGATAILSVFCTGTALILYFRLVHTLGSMGVASQSYLRAAIGVALGMAVLGERLTVGVALGMIAALTGVALINWPARRPDQSPAASRTP